MSRRAKAEGGGGGRQEEGRKGRDLLLHLPVCALVGGAEASGCRGYLSGRGAGQPRTIAGRGSEKGRGGQGKPDEGDPSVSTLPTLPRGAGEYRDINEHANFREEETKYII